MHYLFSVMCNTLLLYADLNVYHEDQFVAVGKPVTIQCHASDPRPVLWEYITSEEENVVNVYDQRLINGYEHRCTIDNSTYDLTIHKTELNDTGEYWCWEDIGFDTRHITKLYVTGIVQICFCRLRILTRHCIYFH